jgi:ATP-dependent DNA helicase DinG
VIFDEAHEIEDIAGQYFGFWISSYRVQDLRRDYAALSRGCGSFQRKNWTGR